LGGAGGKSSFLQRLQDSLAGDSSCHELVLFIHGYNVSFKGAVTSAAQLTFDTSPKHSSRTALAFDWASCHNLFGYTADIKRAESASSKLLSLLGDLAQHLGAQNRVSIIMGAAGPAASLQYLCNTKSSSALSHAAPVPSP
jgi:esterase/lipase superfamily enzyme